MKTSNEARISGKKRGARGVLLGALALGLAACGGGQTRANVFSTDWDDDGGRSIQAVYQRLAATPVPAGADVVVGVTGNGDRLVGQPLAGARWTFTHPLDARPMIAGRVVVGSGGGEIFALDATTGKKLWARPTGSLPLLGAGDDGSITVVTLERVQGPGATLLAIARDGSVTRQIETDKSLGIPAVLGGIAFVPWSSQYVSALDLTNGDEPGRILFREKVSRAFTEGGGLFFGEIGIFRFDDKIAFASKRGASHATLPQRELPGSPVLLTPPEERQRVVASARDRIRLYARPSGTQGPLGIDSDRFFATYFRVVMGFESGKGRLAWVHTHDSDVLGGAAAKGGLVLCDEAGKITELDARTGAVVGALDLGEPVKSCIVQTDSFVTQQPARADLKSLGAQLAEALENKDAQLVTAQRLLLREMATLEDEDATRVLVELASDSETPPQIVADARAALAARRNGARYMTAALARHYDYLKDVLRPPPVGPMAQALAAMKDKAAAPALAAHLLDPADTDDDVKQAASALAVLGDAGEVPSLRQFFVLNSASAEGDDIPAAVVSAGQALLKLGGKDGRSLVERAAADPATVDVVRVKLKGLLEAADAAHAGANDVAPASSATPAASSAVPSGGAAPAKKKGK